MRALLGSRSSGGCSGSSSVHSSLGFGCGGGSSVHSSLGRVSSRSSCFSGRCYCFSGRCSSSCRRFDRSGGRSSNRLFLLAASGEGGSSDQGSQNEGFLHFNFPSWTDKKPELPPRPASEAIDALAECICMRFSAVSNYIGVSSIPTNADLSHTPHFIFHALSTINVTTPKWLTENPVNFCFATIH